MVTAKHPSCVVAESCQQRNDIPVQIVSTQRIFDHHLYLHPREETGAISAQELSVLLLLPVHLLSV